MQHKYVASRENLSSAYAKTETQISHALHACLISVSDFAIDVHIYFKKWQCNEVE